MFRWFRNYTRTKTLFMDPYQAAETKNRLAMAYAFIAWNLFGFVVYGLYKEKVPKANSSVDHAKILGVTNATVLKFSGFNKVDEFDINLSTEEIDEFRDVVGTKEEKELYEKKAKESREQKTGQQLTNT